MTTQLTETTWYDESAGFEELDGSAGLDALGPDDEDDDDEDDDYRD
jgi:hypothetical protein